MLISFQNTKPHSFTYIFENPVQFDFEVNSKFWDGDVHIMHGMPNFGSVFEFKQITTVILDFCFQIGQSDPSIRQNDYKCVFRLHVSHCNRSCIQFVQDFMIEFFVEAQEVSGDTCFSIDIKSAAMRTFFVETSQLRTFQMDDIDRNETGLFIEHLRMKGISNAAIRFLFDISIEF